MQYLLSEDEMKAIRQEREEASKMPSMEALINAVQHIATNMIDIRPINGGEPHSQPHGCIHVRDSRGGRYQTLYCDGCSVARICPLGKDFSK